MRKRYIIFHSTLLIALLASFLLGSTMGLGWSLKLTLPQAHTMKLEGTWLKGWQAQHIAFKNQNASWHIERMEMGPIKRTGFLPFIRIPYLRIYQAKTTLLPSIPTEAPWRPNPDMNRFFQWLSYWLTDDLIIEHWNIDDKWHLQQAQIKRIHEQNKQIWRWHGMVEDAPFSGQFVLLSRNPPYNWHVEHRLQEGSLTGKGISTLDSNTMQWQWSHFNLQSLLPSLPQHQLNGEATYQGQGASQQGTWHITTTANNQWQHLPTRFEANWQQTPKNIQWDIQLKQRNNKILIEQKAGHLHFLANLNKLSQLWPTLFGRLQTEGRLADENVDIALHAKNIHALDYRINDFQLKGHKKGKHIHFKLQGKQITLPKAPAKIEILQAKWQHPLSHPFSSMQLDELHWHTHQSKPWHLAKPALLMGSGRSGIRLSELSLTNGTSRFSFQQNPDTFHLAFHDLDLLSLIPIIPKPYQNLVQWQNGIGSGSIKGKSILDAKRWRGDIVLDQLAFSHLDFKNTWQKGRITAKLTPKAWHVKGMATTDGHNTKIKATFNPKQHDLSGSIEGDHWHFYHPNVALNLAPNITFHLTDEGLSVLGTAGVKGGRIGLAERANLQTLPANTTIKHQATTTSSMLQQVKGELVLKTLSPIAVQQLMGFNGNMEGQITLHFVQSDAPLASGTCTLHDGNFLNIAHIDVERATFTYEHMALSDPLLDILLSRTITPSLMMDGEQNLLEPITIRLAISQHAQNPYIALSASQAQLSSTQKMAALLSGNPYAINTTQNLSLAMRYLSGKASNQKLSQHGHALLSPDELYISTPLQDDLSDYDPTNAKVHLVKYLRPNLTFKTILAFSEQDYLSSLDYLLNQHVHIQAYYAPRRQGLALMWVNNH